MVGKLTNKVAIVTGASRGIGAGIAKRFAAEGARVVLVARTVKEGGSALPGSLNEVAAWIRERGGECICVGADLGSEEDRARIVPEAIAAFRGVDILINNAAWGKYRPAHQQRTRDVRLAWEINVVAPLDLAQQCLESMKARGGGWVVNISSATADLPHPAPYDFDERYISFNLNMGPTIYATTKAGLQRLTAGLAVELAPHGIAVSTLAPVEAVASEGAVELGVIDAQAHYEPVEAMAEAALALSTCPAAELSGRIALSLELLRELGMSAVMDLQGVSPMPDYRF